MFPKAHDPDMTIYAAAQLPQNRGRMLEGLHADIVDKLGSIGDSLHRTWLVSGNEYVVAVQLRAGQSPGWSNQQLVGFMAEHGLLNPTILTYRQAHARFDDIARSS